MIFTLTLVPVLSSMLLKRDVRERNNCIVRFINEKASLLFDRFHARRSLTIGLYGGGGFRIVAFYFLGNGVSSSS